jgi:plasmid maintenance system antidote protein VapI
MTNNEFNADLRAFLARYKIKINDLAEYLGLSRNSIHRRLTDQIAWTLSERIAIDVLKKSAKGEK